MNTMMWHLNRNTLRRLVVFPLFLTLLLLSSISVFADGEELTVTGGTTGGYTYENGVVTFLKGGEYAISMAPGVTETTHQIRVDVAGVYPGAIKLTLSGLNMKRNAGANIDFFYIQESDMEISAEFVLDGENKITNSGAKTDDVCIRDERDNNIDYIVSGSGSLTLKSDRARDWSPRTLTLDSEDAKVILDITAMTAYWLQIKAGTLDITTDDINLTIAGDMLMTGGTLKMKNTSGGSCINLLGTQPKKLGAGVEISGGEVTLEATGQGSSGIISIITAADKDLLIKGSAAVTIHGNGMRPAAILIRHDGNDIVIENGTLRSDGTQTGIYKGTEGSKVYFKGGTTELTTSVYALYQVTADSLIFDSGYDHKNFMGSSAETRVETADNGIISNGTSGRYLLITPVYSITYELNGGSLPEGTSNPVSYLPTDLPIALTDPVLENNTFLGWTGSGADTPTTPFTIPAGTSGDLTYTANWRQDFFSVSSIAGAGIVKTDDSGPAKQTVSNGEAMTTIVYNSDDGHYFPEDYSVPSVNGISVTRISETEINISGTPTADTVIILPDAEKRTEKEPTPAAGFTATGPDSGILSGLEPGAEYTITGLLPEAYTFTAAGTEQKLSGVSPETITIVRKGNTPDTDSDPQRISITKAEKPDASAADCTTKANNDGKLSGVTTGMEYRKAGTDDWSQGTESGEITGLEPETYYVRVRAAGSVLASDSQELVINPYTEPQPTEFKVTVVTDGNGTASADPTSGPTGTEVLLTAQPDNGWEFKEWNVIESGGGTLQSQKAAGTSETAIFIIGTGNAEIEAIFAKEPQPPVPPKPVWPSFFKLPQTGITGTGVPLKDKPASLNYAPAGMELYIPVLDVVSEIVTIPLTDDSYPVQWLGKDAGLLEGFAKPGSGISVIAGHNTLNAEEYGPFALLTALDVGDVLFVRRSDGELLRFTVYANEKIGAGDADALQKSALAYENTLTLLTCEDELPEGGYASRRIVSAKYIN